MRDLIERYRHWRARRGTEAVIRGLDELDQHVLAVVWPDGYRLLYVGPRGGRRRRMSPGTAAMYLRELEDRAYNA